MCLCGPTVVVRRECLQAAGRYFAEGLDTSEDYDFCLRVAEVTQLASLEEPLYLYRQHPNSASRKWEQQQMFNKAVALEKALLRRFGLAPTHHNLATVARDYMCAAVIGVVQNDFAAARNSLIHAMRVSPSLLEQPEPLGTIVRSYTSLHSTEAALAYTESIFRDLLPHTFTLVRLKSRLMSDLHMSEVFARANLSKPRHLGKHLWAGIRHNPAWLLNRGVISILVENLLNSSSITG
jgi:hypothetical protein